MRQEQTAVRVGAHAALLVFATSGHGAAQSPFHIGASAFDGESSGTAQEVLSAALELSKRSERPRTKVDNFLAQVRAV